jgi:hypothetical protein
MTVFVNFNDSPRLKIKKNNEFPIIKWGVQNPLKINLLPNFNKSKTRSFS